MKNLLGRGVSRVFLHTGVHLGFGPNTIVSTSIDSVRHKVTMEVAPVGIVARWADGKEKLFPYPNVLECELEAEVDLVTAGKARA